MEIEEIKKNAIDIYKRSDKNVRKLLENIFGAEIFNIPIEERIKTFHDAIEEIGENNSLVKDWFDFCNSKLKDRKDIKAYMKLRIIAAALNEGWEPKFTEDEWRYSPYFVLYTQEEIDKMSEETKARVVMQSARNTCAYGGVTFANAVYDTSNKFAHYGSSFVFKSRKLAEYAGKQFVNIYMDFVCK